MAWSWQRLLIAAIAAGAILLARKRPAFIALASIVLVIGLPISFFASWFVSESKIEARQQVERAQLASGQYAFGDQPALYAVAQAIVVNNQEAIRAAAKALPDLQAPGRDGTTLLCFAVLHTWQHREAVEAVRTLLSLGADPNHTNGQRNSFAMASSVHGPLEGLRVMLDAGGNPNAVSEYGWPIVFMHFKLGYYKQEEPARLDLLLDRGADINATIPEKDSECPGYSLVLFTTKQGLTDNREYAYALHLLERGADPNRVAPDGMNLAKMLVAQQEAFTKGGGAPREFALLWDWARAHGVIQP